MFLWFRSAASLNPQIKLLRHTERTGCRVCEQGAPQGTWPRPGLSGRAPGAYLTPSLCATTVKREQRRAARGSRCVSMDPDLKGSLKRMRQTWLYGSKPIRNWDRFQTCLGPVTHKQPAVYAKKKHTQKHPNIHRAGCHYDYHTNEISVGDESFSVWWFFWHRWEKKKIRNYLSTFCDLCGWRGKKN